MLNPSWTSLRFLLASPGPRGAMTARSSSSRLAGRALQTLGALLLALALSSLAPAGAQEATWRGVDRVVAVGDVHGDHRQLVTVLQAAGLIDAREHWTGGRTHLVQVGDAVDRGAETRAVLDLLMRLGRPQPCQAPHPWVEWVHEAVTGPSR